MVTNCTYRNGDWLTQAMTGHRYTWDFDNQLQGVDTSGDQVADVTCGYDALGRRVKKTVSGATKIYVSATQPIAYSPQAGQELVEYVSGAVPTSPTEKYVYGDYIDEPLWKTGTGGAVYYHANALYCVSALTNGSGGVVERYRYTPYGELTILAADGTTVRSASTYANSYTYTGRRWDSETGLYFYRARYYHPTLGRFISRDAIHKYPAVLNLFNYCGCMPLSTVNPSGYWDENVHYNRTWVWATRVGYPVKAAQNVASWDNAVDGTAVSLSPGYWPVSGDQSYHFNRNFGGGVDSRLQHMAEHFLNACDLCDWRHSGNDDPEEAAAQLGIALHALQDWVAHGDYGINDKFSNGGIWVAHNSKSPQQPLPGRSILWKYPDDVLLDAWMGPSGRPAGNAMFYTLAGFDYAFYRPGTQRFALTKQVTIQKLRTFRGFVARNGRPNCKCRQYFGIPATSGQPQ